MAILMGLHISFIQYLLCKLHLLAQTKSEKFRAKSSCFDKLNLKMLIQSSRKTEDKLFNLFRHLAVVCPSVLTLALLHHVGVVLLGGGVAHHHSLLVVALVLVVFVVAEGEGVSFRPELGEGEGGEAW